MQQAATQISNDVSPLVRFQEWLKCTQPSTSIRHGCLVDPGEHERDIDDVRKEFREILPVLSFDLDVSELLFGDARKVSRLPVSAHRIIREVLDEFFNVGGCYAQSSKTGFTLVLPNADREIGAMKHDAITVELERRLRAETDPHRTRTVNAGAQKRDKELADLFTRALAKMVPGEDPTSTEIELSRLPWGLMCRYSPMWLVRNKLLTSYVCRPMPAPVTPQDNPNSLWRPGAKVFFKDIRAKEVGDILTVRLTIDDKAELENKTERARDDGETQNIDTLLGLEAEFARKLPQAVNPGGELFSFSTDHETSGDGEIDRSESIELTLAAVVTQVLPNGALAIMGRQEVRVNAELRELMVTGVIRPQDISTDNSITHERIAEMRVAYGGRGMLSELQQPRWGTQIWDIVFPF